VFAFTKPPVEGRPSKKLPDIGQLSFTDFAALGVVGLTRRDTVTEYRKAWQWAIDNGMAVQVRPGDTIELPSIDWPPGIIDHGRGPHTAEVIPGIRRMIQDDPETIQKIVADNPALAVRVAKQVLATPSVRVATESAMAEHQRDRWERLPLPVRPVDYSADVTRAVNLLVPALRAASRGEWQIDSAQQMLLHSLGLLFDQIGRLDDTTPQDELFAEIEKHLREAVA
jgi:hypothetical protein